MGEGRIENIRRKTVHTGMTIQHSNTFQWFTSAEPPPLKCRPTMGTICALFRDLSKSRDDLDLRPDNLGARARLCPAAGDKGRPLTGCKRLAGPGRAESLPVAGSMTGPVTGPGGDQGRGKTGDGGWGGEGRRTGRGGTGPPVMARRRAGAGRTARRGGERSAAGGQAGRALALRMADGGLAGATLPGKGDPRFRAFHQDRFHPAALRLHLTAPCLDRGLLRAF